MNAIRTMAYASIRRHKVRTLSILLMSFLAAVTTVLSASLLWDTHRPWDRAFEAAAGPHLVFEFDSALVSRNDIQATASLPNVAALGEVQDSVVLLAQSGDEKGPLQVVGRGGPGGEVGKLSFVEGRWPEQAGEIAVTPHDGWNPPELRLGESVTLPTAAGPAEFRIVGVLIDLTTTSVRGETQRGWVLPTEMGSLISADAPLRYLAGYRLTGDVSEAGIAAAQEKIGAALVPGAQTKDPLSWLEMRSGSNWTVAAFGSIVYGFALVILTAVALTIASVIAGTVLAGYRDFGVAKALGFTPWQIMGLLVAQVAVPAGIGAILGLPLGVLLASYFLSESAIQLGLPAASAVNPPLILLVAAGFILLVVIAAAVPGLRAARMSAASAISRGRSPSLGNLSRRGSAIVRTRLPRHVGLGAAAVVDRPVRAMLTVGAVAACMAALTFASTFGPTMDGFIKDRATWGAAQDVTVFKTPGRSADDVQALLSQRREVAFSVETSVASYVVSGQAKALGVMGMRGDAETMGFRAAKGRWFAAPGEAVMNAFTAKELGMKLGDTVTGMVNGTELRLTVVGLMNDVAHRGFRVDWNTLTTVAPAAQPDTYLLRLNDGVSDAEFVDSLNAQAGDLMLASFLGYEADMTPIDRTIGGLSVVLVLLAVVGTFNTTLLAMRERLRDTAILKTLGMTGAQITGMVFTFAGVLTVAATAIGIPLGLWMQERIINEGIGETSGFVVEVGIIDVRSIVLIVAGALAVTLLGALVPARRARRLPVAAVLRSE
ncbi:FtsX-like permease family protein [Arthrobacter sp. D1-29]